MFKDIVTAVAMWTVLALIRLPMTILGLFVVLVALPFAKEHDHARLKVTWNEWTLIRLPRWAWLWDNERDGAMGDTRGRFWFKQAPKFLGDNTFLKQYWWMAIRNPCNNFSRFMRPNGVDVRTLEITYKGDYVVKRSDKLLWQFVKGQGPVFTYYQFDLKVPAWGDRHFSMRFGHKISPKYQLDNYVTDEQGYMKGFTARFNFDSPT
jgi:hypothetical protein